MLTLKSKIASVSTNQDDKVFVGEIGKTFKIYSGIDLTGATSVLMKVKKPSGATVEWTATVDTNPYYATYNLVADDVDAVGDYYLSLQTVISGKTLIGESAMFTAYNQFEDGTVYPD
jgi:hypothetical protein